MTDEKGTHLLNDESYRSFFECSLDAMLVLDESGKIVELNQSACEAVKISRDEIVGKEFASLVAPDSRENVPAALEELKAKDVFTGELTLQNKYGNSIPMEWRVRSRAFNGFTIWAGRDIADRLDRERKIKTEVKQKELMLRETHHRMKNNLQFLSSLLNLQASASSDDKVGDLLREYSNRIQTIALINGDLSENGNSGSEIELSAYLMRLAKNLLSAYRVQTDRIRIVSDCCPVRIDISNALPCGLILNEVISNSLKYAFPDEHDGEIKISLQQDGENIVLSISDNGRGLPKGVERNESKSLGIRLIKMLVAQLDGTLEIDGTSGARFHITIPQNCQIVQDASTFSGSGDHSSQT